MTITPTMKWGAAVALALVVGVLAGRFSKPTKVVEVERKVEVAAKVEAKTTDKDVTTTTKKTTTTRTAPGRPAPRAPPASGTVGPECPPVQETVVEEETIVATSDETEVLEASVTASEEEHSLTVENQRAWFAVEATALLKPSDFGSPPGWTVAAQFRIPVLPVWVGAGVGRIDDVWVVPVQARVEF